MLKILLKAVLLAVIVGTVFAVVVVSFERLTGIAVPISLGGLIVGGIIGGIAGRMVKTYRQEKQNK